MQMNKAFLRNSEIVIFDKKKKKIRGRPGEFFFQPAGSKTFLFFHIGLRCSIFKRTRRARKL